MAETSKEPHVIILGFDNVICKRDKWPEAGSPVPNAIDTLKELIEEGHKIVVLSPRKADKKVDAALLAKEYLAENDLDVDWAEDTEDKKSSLKVANLNPGFTIVIDTNIIGIPLQQSSGFPEKYINWTGIGTQLRKAGILEPKE